MLSRIRRLIARQCVWWCLFGIVLAALQPVIGSHFRTDGLENDGEVHVRGVSAAPQFDVDGRPDHQADLETTLFVPSSASIDLPDAFQQGIDVLMALVLLLLPLTVALYRLLERIEDAAPERVPNTSGAPPPPTAHWLRLPPKQAPPLAN